MKIKLPDGTTAHIRITAKTILCRYCGHSIRREPFHHQPSPSRWIHNWTGKRGCVGKSTEAEPEETR